MLRDLPARGPGPGRQGLPNREALGISPDRPRLHLYQEFPTWGAASPQSFTHCRSQQRNSRLRSKTPVIVPWGPRPWAAEPATVWPRPPSHTRCDLVPGLTPGVCAQARHRAKCLPATALLRRPGEPCRGRRQQRPLAQDASLPALRPSYDLLWPLTASLGPEGGDEDVNSDRNGAPPQRLAHTGPSTASATSERAGLAYHASAPDPRTVRGPQNCRLGFTGDARPRFSGPGTPRLPTGTPRLYTGTPRGSGESSSQAPTTLVTRNLCLDPAARLAGGASDQGPGSSFHEARPASTLGPSKAPSPVMTTQQLSLQRKPNCKQVGVAACQGTLSTKHRLWPWGSRLPPLATPPGQTRATQTSSPREPAEDGAQGQVPAQRAWGLGLCMPGQGPGDWCSGSRTTATSRSPPPAAADACARGEPHRLAQRRDS